MTTALVPQQYDLDVEQMLEPIMPLYVIDGWLDEKFARSGSEKTREAYRAHMQSFREFAVKAGVRRLGKGHPDLCRFLGMCLQQWAKTPTVKETLSPASINARIAAISSFYEYAFRMGFIAMNPGSLVKRSPVQAYRNATALTPQEVQEALSCIDTATLQGKRDYAILSLALVTGRRLSEVAGIQMEDVVMHGTIGDPNMYIRIRWRRIKGGKATADRLPHAVAIRLLDYIAEREKAGYTEQHLWVALARNAFHGTALSIKGLQLVCERHVGTTKFHTLRHTFAHAMQEAGADVSEIQRRLMHSSLQTTGIYLQALRADENKHADDLVRVFGMSEDI